MVRNSIVMNFSMNLRSNLFIDNHTNKALAIYMIHPEKAHEIKPKKVFN